MHIKNRLTIQEADLLIDPVVLSLLDKIIRPDLTMDEEHLRISDLIDAIKLSKAFRKTQSQMSLDAVISLQEEAINQIDKIAKVLSNGVDGDSIDEEIALAEYRQQLKATLISRLIIVKAKDGHQKWQRALKVGATIAVGAGAIAAGCLVVKNLKRTDDAAEAYQRGLEEKNQKKEGGKDN